LKQAYNKKTGRTYLSIVQSYRDKEKGYSTSKTIGALPKLDNARFARQFPARQGSADAAYPLGTQGGADAGLREIDRKAGVG